MNKVFHSGANFATISGQIDQNSIELANLIMRSYYTTYNLIGFAATDDETPATPSADDCYLAAEDGTIYDLVSEKNDILHYTGSAWEILAYKINEIVIGGGGGSGTVTSVAAGNGMTFTTITGTGTVTMGTPSTITNATTNSVSAGTHTHALTLPTATTTVLGCVKVDGTSITITDGVISATTGGSGTVTSVAAGNGMTFTTITGTGTVTMGTPSTITNATTNSVSTGTHTHALTLPTATTTVLGCVKVDGTSITITDGVISATTGGSGTVTSVAAGNGMTFTTITGTGTVTMGTPSTITNATTNSVSTGTHTHALTLPTATTTVLGCVKVDGTSITITDGIISATTGGSGTVTSVAAGNGMTFTTITGTGTVTMGTPSNITSTSTNSVASGTHTHALDNSGVTAGSYKNANITVDAKGRITTSASGYVERPFACSDEKTALTASESVAKISFRMPFAMTLSAVRANVNIAPTGSNLIVDIHKSGTSIMTTTKLSIDAGETTSTTAATAAILTDTSLADDEEISVFVDQIGSTVAGAGLKLTFIGIKS